MQYQGSELSLFEQAVHWKGYYASVLQPHVRGDVLEVGAGLGGTTSFLATRDVVSWTCLEPDDALRAQIDDKIRSGVLPATCKSAAGTLEQLPREQAFDTIVYIDVLEHIADDAAEVRAAASRLRPHGKLVILSPAHAWLFSPFDRAVGHHRRYTRTSLDQLRPAALEPVRNGYLDAVGMAASLANRMLLRSAHPTKQQVALWDRVMVPASRVVDPLLGFRLGKSVYAVWSRVV